MFWFRNKKINFWFALLTKGLIVPLLGYNKIGPKCIFLSCHFYFKHIGTGIGNPLKQSNKLPQEPLYYPMHRTHNPLIRISLRSAKKEIK